MHRGLALIIVACGGNSAAPDAGGDAVSASVDAMTCTRTPPGPDHTRRVVVSHPYDAASAQANDWEVLDLSTTGTFSRPNHHFTMGRADVGEVAFTPDGKVGIAVQGDGTLGVFSLDDSGVPAVIAPKFKGGFYAERVVMAARGDHAYVLDDEFRDIGGGIYRIDIGCDGSISDRGLVLAGKLPAALAFAASGDAIVAAVELGTSTTNGVHLATWGATPAVVASATAFPDDMAIVGGSALTHDGAFFMIGDGSQFASVPNRVAVVPVTGETLGTAYVIPNVMDPLALIASPFTDDVLVASGFGNALYTLHRDGDGMWRNKGEITYQGAKPQLPGGAVRIDGGALAGTVLVGENLGVRRVELGANGVTDHGLYSLGTGLVNVVGAVGVTPVISARRVAIGAGVLAMVLLFDVFCLVRVPGFVAGMFGPSGGVARFGGVVARWSPPPGLDLDALRQRFAARAAGTAVLRRDGDAVVVEVPNVREADASSITAMLTEGSLEFREVIESMATYELVKLGLAFDPPRHGAQDQEPQAEIDQWRPEDGGARHQDSYAFAHSREALVEMFAEAERRGWQRPPHTVVMFEREEPSPDAKDPRTYWRSYLVSDEVPLDGMSIASATGSYDPNTNRPIVLLDFDREGGRIFGDLTARITGHKLATVVGQEVRSAPIINGAIRGGRASITMGSGDPQRMERERDLLVQTLRSGTLPLGGKIIESHWVPPGGGTTEWIGRALIAIVGGLAAGVLAWFAIAFAKPERRSHVVLEGTGGRGKRLVWTLLAVGLYLLGLQITVPWINDAELSHLLAKGGHAAGMNGPSDSIFGLGIAPLLTSFILVEVVATLVPQLRRYRDGGADRRRWLALAVALVATFTALTQAYFITKYYDGMEYYGIELIDPGGRWPTILTLVAGTLCLAWLASIISERGIGNGYAVLTIVGLAITIPRYWWWEGKLESAHILLVAVALVAIVIIAATMLGWQVRSPRSVAIPIPASGISPLNPGAGALIVIAQVLALGISAPTVLLAKLDALQRGIGIGLIVVLAGTAAWSLAFAWPGRRAAELAKCGREPADVNVWSRAVVLSIGALLAISAISRVVAALAPELAFLVDPLVLLLVVASVIDFGAEWRARRRELVAVWPLHDPLLVDAVADRLAAAGIPHHIQATRLRSLLWLFGSFAPMTVLVPREHGEVAQSLLRDWLET